jgi:hypothetical protein
MTVTLNDKGVFLTGPVVLEGYQAILKPSKFGYSLSALLPEAAEEVLDEDRERSLKWAESKLKNPKRSTLKPEPWEAVDAFPGKLKAKFTWNEDTRPFIYDTEGVTVDDPGLPLYSGSIVRLAFKQKPYILKDGVTYGTSLKLVGVQIVSLRSNAGTDSGDLSEEEVSNFFKMEDVNGMPPEKERVPFGAPEEDPTLDF